jgi:hypothetical protein
MSPPALSDLVAKMQAAVTDPDQTARAAAIALDAANVTTLMLTDPVRAKVELGHLNAQILSLGSEHASAMQAVWTEWVHETMIAVIQAAFARA